MDQLRQGKSNPEIARQMGISRAGAKYHVSEILGKLSLASRYEAATWRPSRRAWWLAGLLAFLPWPFKNLWWGASVKVAAAAAVVATVAVFAVPDGFGLLVTDPEIGPVPDFSDFSYVTASGRVRLAEDPTRDVGSTWSSDCSRIAFTSNREGSIGAQSDVFKESMGAHSDIFTMNPDGTDIVNLTGSPRPSSQPAWSPDGARIAYASEFQGNSDIYVMNSDGTSQTNLTKLPGLNRDPAWSPDGERILFTRYRGLTPEIYVMNSDGTQRSNLSQHEATDGWANWSPDGTKIVFLSRESRHYPDDPGGIFVMNADGSDIIRLTTDDFEVEVRSSSPDWAPGSVPTGLVAKPPSTTSVSEPALETTATGLQLVGTALTEPLESPLAGVWVNGNYAYVGSQSISYQPGGGFRTGIRIVDISDPANPALVGRIPLRSFEYDSGPSDVHSHGDAVVTRIESAAFQGDIAIVLQGVPDTFGTDEYPVPFGIWDVTDPAVPEFLSPLSLGNWFSFDILGDKLADTKAVKGHYFYTIYSLGEPVHAHPNPDKHLAIVDMSDPRNPVVVGDWQDTKQVHLRGLSVNDAGTRVYIVGQFGNELLLYVLDVQDPENPVELGRFVWPYPFAGDFSPGRPVANADDSVVIFADGSWDEGRSSRLHVLDISDLSSIREISTVAFPESDTHQRG